MEMTALEVAREQIGVTEYPPGSNNVKYNTWYYGREVSGSAYPWCMVFVQWCFAAAGTPLPFKTASCSALLNWYRQNMPERIVSEPQAGDVAIYDFGHTGLVASATATAVTAVEGNTSLISDDNGGAVMERVRSRSVVEAFVRPVLPLQNETDGEALTQFIRLFDEMRGELRKAEPSPWSEAARRWAVDSGLVLGGSAEGFRGMWMDFVTREQLVTVLYRFAKRYGMV